MSYRFGPFQLDPVAGRLLRDEQEIELQPKAMALLGTFVQHPERLFSRAELLDEVWPDVVVSDHSLSQALFKLRHALEVSGDEVRWVQTVHGRGYRFVGEVTVDAPAATSSRPHDGFVGRADELARLDTVWDGEAMGIALVGPGGQGKTRLAVQHASLQTRWPEVQFVDLVSATSRADAVGAVAQALGVALHPAEPVAQLGRALKARGPMLVVLDNLESVREGMEPLIAQWVTAAPEARWLLTSRERTSLPGFVEFALEGMSSADALGLFLARAEDRSVRLEARWHSAIRAIGEHLDGQPLGIELAVSRVSLLDPDALLERLVAQRTPLGTLRGAAPRHQSMHATVQWSWDLLGGSAQRLLLALSLFRGPFTVRMADAVVGADALDTLGVLTDSFLVRPVADLAGRLRLPEPIRDFLADTEVPTEIVGRFVDAMDALAGEALPPWIDLPNLRAALDHPAAPAAHVRIAVKVSRMLTGLARPQEAQAVLEGLPTEAVDERLQDDVLRMRAEAVSVGGVDPSLIDALDSASRRALARGDDLSAGRLLANLSFHAHLCKQAPLALDAAERAMAASERAGDLEWVAMGAYRVATALLYQGEAQRARRLLERGVASLRDHHSPRRQGMLLDLLATLSVHEGRAAEALELQQRSVTLLEASGEVSNLITTSLNRAATLQEVGRFEEALALQLEHYHLVRRQGLEGRLGQLLVSRSVTFMHLDRLDEAWADLVEAASSPGRSTLELLVGVNRSAVACLRGEHAEAIEHAERTLADSGEQRVVQAATRVWLALSLLGLGDVGAARRALEASDRTGLPGMVTQALEVADAAVDGRPIWVHPDQHPLAHLTARGARRALPKTAVVAASDEAG